MSSLITLLFGSASSASPPSPSLLLLSVPNVHCLEYPDSRLNVL